MPTYDHAYTLAFSIGGSTHPQGDDLTEQQLAAAILRRVADLLSNGYKRSPTQTELHEAVGAPYDTFEED